MQRSHLFLSLLPGLIFILFLGACSNDEAPPAAASDAPAAAQEATAIEGQPPVSNPWPENKTALISEYDEQCPEEEDPSLECEWLRGLVVADVVQALEEIEDSRDQRGVEEALAALDLEDEPEILVAACRILGRFPDTPGIAEKVTPLLLYSPYLEVQQFAANLLSRNPDQALAEMGSQWSKNHGALYTDEPYAELPGIPAQYFDMDFPEYPNAERYTPADSDRSVGWWVAGSPAEVSAGLAAELGGEVVSYEQWVQRLSAEQMTAYQAILDQPQAAEMQQLTTEYMQNQDPALLEKIQQLQTEMETVSQKLQEDSDKALNNVLLPPGGVAPEEVYYLIAEQKDGHVSRAILVYRHAGAVHTVMQMAWNLGDYPSAWPETN